MSARVAGLDLSLSATGVALAPSAPIQLRTIKPKTKGDLRLIVIRDHVWELLSHDRWDLVMIEDVPFGMRNNAAGPLALLHGAVRAKLMDEGVRYLTVPPATLKTYATGKGNAKKPDMRMELYKRTGRDVDDDNQVDAIWLQYLGRALMGWPDLELPQSHTRALDKLTMEGRV